MSASLVGSEMCIRDRRSGAFCRGTAPQFATPKGAVSILPSSFARSKGVFSAALSATSGAAAAGGARASFLRGGLSLIHI
eukprot:12446024-Alexandrium_andersonii.AAC.1